MPVDYNFQHSPDPVDLEGNAQGSLALSTTAAHTAALPLGIYDVWADADCFIKIGAIANDVTTATGYQLYKGNVVSLIVRKDRRIGGIVAAATATLFYHKVN